MRQASLAICTFLSASLLLSLTVLTPALVITAMFPAVCLAQPKARSLLNSAAGAKADERRRQLSGQRSSLDGHEVTAFDLQPDSVDDILWSSSNRDSEFFGDYRGVEYLGYVHNAVGLGTSDDIEQSSFAQRLLVYQAVKTVGEHLQNSTLDTYYRQALGALKRVRRNTTVQVVQEKRGELSLEKGEKEQPLVEIKLHASMRNGVEPRLRFGKHLTLRFDPLNQDTLFEFRSDF